MTVPRMVQQSMLPDVPERPVGQILASVQTGTNSDLMAAVAPLYLTGSVMDVTWGRGGWWQRFTPDPFTRHDLYTLDGVDFRALPEADNSVDTVCFDPPYVISGGESTVNLGPDFQQRYGVGERNLGLRGDGYGEMRALPALILAGLDECCRVASRFVLVKCMEFSQGRQFHDIPFDVTTGAKACGWRKHDQIVHHTGSGPGGQNIFDVKRARRHHSYLLVFASHAQPSPP